MLCSTSRSHACILRSGCSASAEPLLLNIESRLLGWLGYLIQIPPEHPPLEVCHVPLGGGLREDPGHVGRTTSLWLANALGSCGISWRRSLGPGKSGSAAPRPYEVEEEEALAVGSVVITKDKRLIVKYLLALGKNSTWKTKCAEQTKKKTIKYSL